MHKKIEALIEEKKNSNRKEDVDKRIVECLVENLKQSKDYNQYLEDIERLLCRYYPLAASGMVAGFSVIPIDQKTLFVESLVASRGKPFVYHVSASLLMNSLFSDGIDILAKCCDPLTDYGTKSPTSEVKRKFESAFLTAIGLKEKPMKALLDRDGLSVGIVIFILSTLFDSAKSKGLKKNTYPILLGKALTHAEKVWGKLVGEKQKHFANVIKPIINTKKMEDILRTNGSGKVISKDFIEELFLENKNRLSENEETLPSSRVSQECLEYDLSQTETNLDLKEKSPDDPKPIKLPDFEPLKVVDDILAWIQDCPTQKTKKLFNWMEKNDPVLLIGKIAKLSEENEELKSKLSHYETLLSEKNKENEKLKTDLQNSESWYLEKVRQMAAEHQDQEREDIQDLKDDVAQRIQPLIDDYLILKNQDDLDQKCYGMEKIFENFIEILKFGFDIEVAK